MNGRIHKKLSQKFISVEKVRDAKTFDIQKINRLCIKFFCFLNGKKLVLKSYSVRLYEMCELN